ncbi:MAG: hypothetical protein PHV55_06650 [Candidatus Omnitrophica bacterium]|nr:hypothetical protein [Candidatus Omnitrophota bacterium]
MNTISTLKLFNEKVDKLINSRFVKHIQENKGLKVSIKSSVGEKVGISHNLPDQDAIDAFVLTVRFFIQDNESTSLHNMAELYTEISVSQNIKDDFNYVRDKLNSELSKKSMFNLQGKNLTRREVFDTFIYGGLAHAEAEKKEDFDKWMRIEPLAAFITAEFNNVLIYFLDCIAYIKKVNLRALEELAK